MVSEVNWGFATFLRVTRWGVGSKPSWDKGNERNFRYLGKGSLYTGISGGRI